MRLLSGLSERDQRHVEARLRHNAMAWLTTVRPSGAPDLVPVWFLLREDETVLIYSQSGQQKLRNLEANPGVALGLDVTDIGRDVVRLTGRARIDASVVPAHENDPYVEKYAERIGALFGSKEAFSSAFEVAIVVQPTKAHVMVGRPSTPG